MSFAFIDREKATMSLPHLCRLAGVSVSLCYAWKHRAPSRRQFDGMILLAHIRARFSLSRQSYGSARIYAQLCDDGIAVGRHRVARLMRENDLKARQRTRFKRTTDSRHDQAIAPNLLEQDFTCDGMDQKWGADISYIWTTDMDNGRLALSCNC